MQNTNQIIRNKVSDIVTNNDISLNEKTKSLCNLFSLGKFSNKNYDGRIKFDLIYFDIKKCEKIGFAKFIGFDHKIKYLVEQIETQLTSDILDTLIQKNSMIKMPCVVLYKTTDGAQDIGDGSYYDIFLKDKGIAVITIFGMIFIALALSAGGK